MFYRLLRPGESIENGLSAKDPNSKTSVFAHVTTGSYGQSKYISACRSEKAVLDLKDKSKNRGTIVNIDEAKLQLNNVEIINLKYKKTRDNYIDDNATEESIKTFHNYAKTFQEVLLVGHVPKSCLINYV